MNASCMRRASVTSALLLLSTIGSANAAQYSWSEILVPSIGPIGSTFGPNDKGQVAVTNVDGSKTGIYRNGVFTPLPPPPAGYKITPTGISDGGTIVGLAFSPADSHARAGVRSHRVDVQLFLSARLG